MIVKLDGVALEVDANTQWVELSGTAPFVLQLEVDAAAGLALFEAASGEGGGTDAGASTTRTRAAQDAVAGSTLEFEANGVAHTVKGLTILGLAPSSNPDTIVISVVDLRWKWGYPHVARHFNKRRKTPAKRRSPVPEGAQELPADAQTQATVTSDDIAFAAYSIKNHATAYTSQEAITEVFDLVIGQGKWTDRDNVLTSNTVLVEDWVFGMQGNAAIAKCLSYLGGGANVYVNTEAQTILYNMHDDGERAALGLGDPTKTRTRADKEALRAIVGPPLFAMQDRRKERPSKIRVLFERLPEARIDIDESEDLNAGTRVRGGSIKLRASNVIPLPQDGTINGAAVVKGTWVTLNDYIVFLAENDNGNILAAKLPLTRERIRKLWLSNAWNSYASPVVDPTGVWRERMGNLREHYRRTFQIRKEWRDRIREIQPFRVGIEDTENQARASALVFQDYCVVHAWTPLGVGDQNIEDEIFRLTQNRLSNPDADDDVGGQIIDTDLVDLVRAPATLRVLDQDLGILQVTLAKDFTGLADRYVRSATVASDGSVAKFDERKILLQDTDLTPNHEVSILLTLSMGAPNDKRRFYAIEVDVAQAEEQWGSLQTPSRAGEGPVLELRVGNPRAVARFAWDDGKATAFWDTFTALPGDGSVPSLGDPVNLNQLTVIARTHALAEYLRFRDHPEGSLTTDFRPEVTIAGNIARVTHDFSPGEQGGALTTIDMAPSLPAVDAQALMPPDIRRMVDGFVDP